MACSRRSRSSLVLRKSSNSMAVDVCMWKWKKDDCWYTDSARGERWNEVRALNASFVLAFRALFLFDPSLPLFISLRLVLSGSFGLSRLPPAISRKHTVTSSKMAEGGIDRKMEERMEFSTSKEVRVAPTFEAMHLKENLLRGIYAYGYESPSAVQSRAIVQICKGRDTIAQAQSGTGKTATFSISILQVIDTAVRETQGELRLSSRINLFKH